MKCDQCDCEATVHEVTVRNGVKIEKHLCESCATSHGIAVQPTTPINELIKHYVLAHGITPAPAVPAQKGHVCALCRTTFAEFRQHGLLGCPECYRTFEAQLGPLIERAHEGGIKHVGKLPRRQLGKPETPRGLSMEERAERLRRIRKELDSAVKTEQYELAAKLRDELKKLGIDASRPQV